jgi:hypothetical protein
VLVSSFVRLGKFIFEVGKLVAKACEGFGAPLAKLHGTDSLLIPLPVPI